MGCTLCGLSKFAFGTFIALWAISKTNPAKVEALKTEFVKIFDYTSTQTVKEESKTQENIKAQQKKKAMNSNR